MTAPLMLGDIQDFHSCWVDGNVFHVADTADNQITERETTPNCKKFDHNLVYYEDGLQVLTNGVQRGEEQVFSAVDSEICCYSNGSIALQNGQVLNSQYQTVHKFSDTPCYLDYNPASQRLIACSMSGELMVQIGSKLQVVKIKSTTRGQIRFSVICPTCCLVGPYVITANGARMLTQLQSVVIDLDYQGVRKVQNSNKVVGMQDHTVSIFEIDEGACKCVARKEFLEIKIIDCLAIERQAHFECCLIYQDLNDSFKCARYEKIQVLSEQPKKAAAKQTPVRHQDEIDVVHDNPQQPKRVLEPLEPLKQREELDLISESDGLSQEQEPPADDSLQISALSQSAASSSSDDKASEQASARQAESAQPAPLTYVQQFFTLRDEEVVSAFSSPGDKQQCIEQAALTVFVTNQYGQIVGSPAGQQFQITVKSAERPIALQFSKTCLHADLGASSFCLLLEDHLLLQRLEERQPLFRTLFSRALTGSLIKLINDASVAATFQNGADCQVLIIYQSGVPVFSKTARCFTHLASTAGLLLTLEDDSLVCAIDVFSFKTVYSGRFSIGRTLFFQATRTCCYAASERGVFQLDFEDSFQSAVNFVLVHSFVERELAALAGLQTKVQHIMSGASKEALTRSELEQIRASFPYVLYCEEVDGRAQFQSVLVEQAGLRLDATRKALLDASRGLQLDATFDAAAEFKKDTADLKARFPLCTQPQFDIESHPELTSFFLSPPVNADADAVDAAERRFFLQILRVRSVYGLSALGDDGPDANNAESGADSVDLRLNGADIAFDLALIEYAQAIAEVRLFERLRPLPFLCRTRSALDGLRQLCMNAGAAEPAASCLSLGELRFSDTEFAREATILPTIQPHINGVFARRLDDMGFSFVSGDARSRFDQLEKETRAKIEDLLSSSAALKQRQPRSSPAAQRAFVAPDTDLQEPTQKPAAPQDDYAKREKAAPDANKNFLSALRKGTPAGQAAAGAGSEAAKKPQMTPKPPKAAPQSGTPLKQQMSLGDALGGL